MKRLRAAVVLASTALISAATITSAAAWPPGSITIKAECEDKPGELAVTVGDKYRNGADFTLTNDQDDQKLTGHVPGRGTTKVTVPYAGKAVKWTVTVVPSAKETLTASVEVGVLEGCAPETPKPPTPTPSTPTPTPTPSETTPTPTPSTTTPTPTPSESTTPPATPEPSKPPKPSTPPNLAETGSSDGQLIAIGAAGAVLIAGGGAVLVARRGRRQH
ncbi:LPXTG cell wall anchor domain-containing protein [Streptomyces sp. NPDC090025]|uniref:LPXTG cell wall anchor domain-containing protein n=1 Tax=Streptomyces sp. NPDC090025 TaxID=3365922 RepID=UPI0038396151